MVFSSVLSIISISIVIIILKIMIKMCLSDGLSVLSFSYWADNLMFKL